jgi:signal transduction histidine kinase
VETLAALQRSERVIAIVRWVAAAFAALQVTLYEPPLRSLADDALAARPAAYALVGVLVLVGVAVEVLLRTARRPGLLARVGLAVLVADLAVVLGFVFLYAFDPFSAQWTLLTVLPLEGALRFQLRGSLGVWAAIVPAYLAREVLVAVVYGRAVSVGAVSYRLGLLLVIALFAGFIARDLYLQRRRLTHLLSSSQQVASRLEHAEILRTLCREACSCLDAGAAVVYVSDGDWFQPVASWPPDALVTVLDEEQDDEGRPELVQRLLAKPLWLHADEHHPARLTVPMRWRDDPAANLLVVRPRHGRPNGFEVEIAASLAESAALALATTRVLSAEQRSNERLRYLEALRTRFVATIAHDLRLPLTVFKGVSQILRRKPNAMGTAQVDALLHNVERQANRLARLADDLLDAARLDSDKLVLHPEPVRLADVVAATVADVGDEVVVDVDPSLALCADPARLERVLWNLLSNADKYGRPPLEVRGWREDAHVCISVRDHGRGLDAAQRARLFTEFAGTDDAGSVGLGLAIVWQLVAAHGGQVRYEDAEPGARFTLSVPVADGVAGHA